MGERAQYNTHTHTSSGDRRNNSKRCAWFRGDSQSKQAMTDGFWLSRLYPKVCTRFLLPFCMCCGSRRHRFLFLCVIRIFFYFVFFFLFYFCCSYLCLTMIMRRECGVCGAICWMNTSSNITPRLQLKHVFSLFIRSNTIFAHFGQFILQQGWPRKNARYARLVSVSYQSNQTEPMRVMCVLFIIRLPVMICLSQATATHV